MGHSPDMLSIAMQAIEPLSLSKQSPRAIYPRSWNVPANGLYPADSKYFAFVVKISRVENTPGKADKKLQGAKLAITKTVADVRTLANLNQPAGHNNPTRLYDFPPTLTIKATKDTNKTQSLAISTRSNRY